MSTTDNRNVNPETTPDSDLELAVDASIETEPEVSWTASDWLGKVMIARDGERIGKLHDVYVDVETDVPQFGTVKKGFFKKHLAFVPLTGVTVSPNALHVTALKQEVRSAPRIDVHGEELSQADESALYHHYEMNYTKIQNESGRRLARR